MKRISLFVLALAIVALGPFAIAGSKHAHHDCEHNAQDCLDALHAKLQARGWVGINTTKTDDGTYKVVRVEPNSPASEAGLRAGDVLLAVNGVALKDGDKEKLIEAKRAMKPGAKATYVIARAGSKEKVAVVLGQMPLDLMAESVGAHMLKHHSQNQIASTD